MATVLDLGVLEILTPVFVFIFVFVVLYAIFLKLKIFGDSQALHALISFAFAVLFVVVADLRELVTFFVPWVAVFFVLIIVILIAIMLLGISQKDITSYLMDNPGITTTVIVFTVLIFLIALSQVFPGSIGYPENGDNNTLRKVIFHPKVLGVALVIVIMGYVVRSVGFKR